MAKLRQFFDDYATALSAADVEGIAGAYADQFMATGPGFRMANKNDEQFRRGLAQAAQFYRQIGVDVIEIKNYLEAELGSGFWLAKIEWELLDEDLNDMLTFDNTYLVEAGDGKPQIVLFIAHNEQQRMQEKGLMPSDRGD
ncbi:MAG: hypothetical protein IT328_10370 [Caldilineaceae bacterium]|nr:hypothetical protein [Caldilineaceae bacterium]